MKSRSIATLFVLGAVLPLTQAGEKALLDTVHSPAARMYMTDLGDTRWQGGLWGDRFQVCRDTMVPNIWRIFQSDDESHEWTNLLLAADPSLPGKHEGPNWADGDFFKWFESLAVVYAVTHDPAADQLMDRVIAVIGRAQRNDGYFHTAAMVPQRRGDTDVVDFGDGEHFETYNIGHLITAACMHYRATGKTTFLAIARKAADYLGRLIARSPATLARSAICPAHYMAVVELYRTTGDRRYLELAEKLVALRDTVKDGTDQNQDRVPFREQTKALGHAVRANYLYAGATDVAMETGDDTLFKTVGAISRDVSEHKLYITGQTGALYDGASPDGGPAGAQQLVNQAYGRDYQLPELAAYNESCATVGYVLWNWRMLLATGDAHYADLVEQSLYNGVLAAISLDGKDYFYVNPLRRDRAMSWPFRTWRTRQPNLTGCFCCPPNVVRTIAEAQEYIYTLSPGALWVNLYGGSSLRTQWVDGGRIALRQETDYPWNGAVRLTIAEAPGTPVAIRLRIPGWLDGAADIRVNGEPVAVAAKPGTYAEVRRVWRSHDVIELSLRLHATVWAANPLVEEAVNQGAVRFGPIVYCVESADLPPGVSVDQVALPASAATAAFSTRKKRIAGAEVLALQTPAWQVATPDPGGALYQRLDRSAPAKIPLTLIPYYAWNNRGDCDMKIWLPLR